jgi:hypothetical protein
MNVLIFTLKRAVEDGTQKQKQPGWALPERFILFPLARIHRLQSARQYINASLDFIKRIRSWQWNYLLPWLTN